MTTKRPERSAPTFLELLGLDGRPSGYADVRVLVRAHDVGDPLPPEPLGRILDALRAFLGAESTDVQLQEFGRRANLRGKQGRHQSTAAEAVPHELAVAEVFQRERVMVANGIAPRKARATATKEVAKARHCTLKTMQDHIRQFGEGARLLLVAIDYSERMELDARAIAARWAQHRERENKS